MKRRFLALCLIIAMSLVLASVQFASAQTVITVEPTDTLGVDNCFPFGIGALGNWTPYAGFVYQNVPAFDILPGDIIAFDLGSPNDANIQLEISMAPTTVNGGDVNSGAFTTVVTNTQTPANPMGDAITGNFELQFTVENPFSFPGGGLIIRFSNPSAAYQADTSCTQVLTWATSGDSSGYFVRRFYRDADGVSTWDEGNFDSIGGFQIISQSSAQVPTMNEWGVIIFVLIAGAASVVYLRKRKTA